MKYKLALFDFDGTLADSAQWFLTQMNQVADEMGFRRIQPADYEKVRGYSSKQVIEYVGLPMWKLPRLMARMRKAAGEHRGEIQLFPGVGKMLATLSEHGIGVGIVSSNSEKNIREMLGPEHCRLIKPFSCGSSLFGKAAKLRGVLRRIGVKANQAIYIGDEIRDGVAAREVGMSFGAVAWGFATIEALRRENPTEEFAAMEEIAEKLSVA